MQHLLTDRGVIRHSEHWSRLVVGDPVMPFHPRQLKRVTVREERCYRYALARVVSAQRLFDIISTIRRNADDDTLDALGL